MGESHLGATLQALESGLRVADIATFHPFTCRPDEQAARILGDPALSQYDQFPVATDGTVVGVLERVAEDRVDAPVRKLMKPIAGGMLVEAELPLPRFVSIAARSPYYLVVHDARIDGLITRSDLLKMPVRLMAFAFVAHLEARMAEFIGQRHSKDEWIELLPPAERTRLTHTAKQLAGDRLDPNLIDLTVMSQKAIVVARTLGLSASEVAELKSIRLLRNDIAHGKPFAESDADLEQFIATLRSVERWIAQLRGYTAGVRDWSKPA